MKKILCLILASMMLVSVEAQVSVRRTSRKTEKIEKVDKTEKKDDKQTDKQKVEEKTAVAPVATQPAASQPVATQPAVVKKTSPETKKKSASRTQANIEGMSLRRQLFEQNQPQSSYANRWQRVIYRELDLTKDVNAVLYYPEVPTDGLTNMFCVLFDAFVKGNLKAYEYIDGRELLDEAHLVKVEDVLETHDIDPSDVPCYQVLSYYIKEQWDFDRNTSQYQSHIVALCPILHRQGEFGGITRYPLFWLSYDDLRPFIIDKLVMSSGINTAVRYSLDDFFTLRKYDGEIYKVQNPRGLTLMQQYPDEAQLKAKREEIENELQNFGKSVWVPQEKEQAAKPAAASSSSATSASTGSASTTSVSSSSSVSDTGTSVEKNKQTSESEKRRSVRRNRRTKEAVQGNSLP